MQPSDIDKIRDTFVHALFDPDRASRLFYDRLFALAPETRALFATDMTAQGRLLIRKLAMVVTGLDRFDAIAPLLCDLAVRHVAYGARPHHYPLVIDAMMHMLTVVGGDAFDASARVAWENAVVLITETMIAAAYPSAAA